VSYDEVLADRVREELRRLTGSTASTGSTGSVEKKMFGGLAFMVDGTMAVGLRHDGLLVRADAEAALAEPGVRPFEMMPGRPAKDFVVVAAEVLDDENLKRWVTQACAYAATLPPKKPKKPKKN
jgi:TfoX/Sxy family transcriptional regulator of competence genes